MSKLHHTHDDTTICNSILSTVILPNCCKSEQVLTILIPVPEYEVKADNGLGLRCLAVVQDGGLSFCPDKAATVGQETVVAGADLTFGQHYTQWAEEQNKKVCLNETYNTFAQHQTSMSDDFITK